MMNSLTGEEQNENDDPDGESLRCLDDSGHKVIETRLIRHNPSDE